MENLEQAGARVIVFDITMDDSSKVALNDSLLRQTLQKYNNIVIATTVGYTQSNKFAEVRTIEPTFDNKFYSVDKNIGVTNIIKDRDDVCRSHLPLFEIKGWGTPTLAFAALNRYFKLKPGDTITVAIPANEDSEWAAIESATISE